MKPDLLFLINLPEAILQNLSEHYNCHLYSALDEQQFLAVAPSIRAIVSSAESTNPYSRPVCPSWRMDARALPDDWACIW